MDEAQPGAAGGGRRTELEGLAADLGDGTRIGTVVAGQRLDERRLAAAVGADESVDLTRLDGERYVGEARWPANVLDTLEVASAGVEVSVIGSVRAASRLRAARSPIPTTSARTSGLPNQTAGPDVKRS